MNDTETVLNGLRNEENWKAWGIEGIPAFAMDAILLIRRMDDKLKEYEEPAKPIINNGDEGVSWWYRCSACGREINFKTHFCQWCGKPLTWD